MVPGIFTAWPHFEVTVFSSISNHYVSILASVVCLFLYIMTVK